MSALERVERRPLEGAGNAERWLLLTRGGDTLRAIWNPGRETRGRRWVAVLLGGLHTGDQAALLLPPSSPVATLALDWPWDGPLQMGAAEFALQLGRIREALLRSPAAIALGAQAVRAELAPDSPRVVVVGVSLGVPPAIASLEAGPAPDALVLIDGAADVRMLLAASLATEVPQPLVGPLASLGARLIDPLEPARHFEAARGVPTLLMNARGEERLPRAAVAQLHRGLPTAEKRWREGEHVRPSRTDAVRALAIEAAAWVTALPDPAAPVR
jgi:hypothetical protein